MQNPPLLLLLALLAAGTSACVSTKKYNLALSESQLQDSLRRSREADLRQLREQARGLERDTARLGASQRDLQGRYEALSAASAQQSQQLSGQLQATSAELQARNAELQARNAELQQQQQALEVFSRELKLREQTVNELNAIIRRQDSLSQALLAKVEGALVGFSREELTVTQKNGKVYVSLSEQLLFASGSAEVNPKGRDALLKLAEVLNKDPDFEVVIEGHTDNVPIKTAIFKDNWDLSVLRATSVVRLLIWSGKMDPKRLVPSGRGEYFPVADNADRNARKLNRRTEIILSPRLDELISLLKTQ
jgi:chemotaxis protein MotB